MRLVNEATAYLQLSTGLLSWRQIPPSNLEQTLLRSAHQLAKLCARFLQSTASSCSSLSTVPFLIHSEYRDKAFLPAARALVSLFIDQTVFDRSFRFRSLRKESTKMTSWKVFCSICAKADKW